jgi:hypothetical protein
MTYFLLAIYTNYALLLRPVLYQWGLSLPDTYFGIYGASLTILFVLTGANQYLKSGGASWSCTRRHRKDVKLWFSLIASLGVYGVLRGNAASSVYREVFVFFEMGAFLLLGADDRFWQGIEKHLTVLFYLAVALIFVYQQTPVPAMYASPLGGAADLVNFRSSNSVAYYIRPLIGPGLLLGMWGLVRRGGGVWRIAQVSALVLFFGCEAAVFQFRSEAVFTALAVVSFLLLRPIFERRLRPGVSTSLLVAVVLGLGYYLGTESWTALERRQTVDDPDMMSYRFAELEAYKADLGWNVLVGRGLGGSFDASALRSAEEGADKWGTLHFGLVVFTLKGGVFLLAMFLSFLGPGIPRRARSWYSNPYNLIAALLFPIYLVAFVVNPITLFPEGLLLNLPPMMILARFGAKQNPSGTSCRR